MPSFATQDSNMASQSVPQNPVAVFNSLPSLTSGSTQEHRGINNQWVEIEKQVEGQENGPDTEQPQHVFNEGGRAAWLTVLGWFVQLGHHSEVPEADDCSSFMVFFSTFGMLTAFGVFECEGMQ